MSSSLVTKIDANDALSERFDRYSATIYKTVIVLLLYWKSADGNYKGEADQLEHLFGQRFKYKVRRFEIPDVDSDDALDDEIRRVRQLYSTPRSLIIIHYGGHGDEDNDRPGGDYPPKKSVWAPKRDITSKETLNWSYIQPQLGRGKGDFLVILDCCFGAQAARASYARVIPSNVELLAAAPMGKRTPEPGPFSFTHAFIEEVESALAEKNYADISEIHHKLAAGDRKLIQTPTHFCHGRQATIRLQPHSTEHDLEPIREPEATLMIEMLVNSPLDRQLLDKIVRWLTNFAPHEVFSLQVTDLVHRATAAQNFILSESANQRSVLKLDTLTDPSKSEVRDAWSSFNWNLWHSLKWLPSFAVRTTHVDPPTQLKNEMTSDETRIKDFLKNFDANISLLEDVIERNVLAVPELLEEANLSEAIQDSTSKELGIVRSLQMRLENIQFEKALQNLPSTHKSFLEFRDDRESSRPGSVVCKQHPEYGRILVEYSYRANEGEALQRKNDARMDHLVKILGESNPDFNTFTCLGWTASPSEFRYMLIFKNIHGDSLRPITLFDAMNLSAYKKDAVKQPTLGQRFSIAQTIGRTLLKWHEVGWVHESISSQNIIFFQDRATGVVDYSKPYLYGFSYSRLTSRYSTPHQDKNDILRDVYQHPDRQGTDPEERHTKEHDLYSFGVLLFEIGFWGRASTIFKHFVNADKVSLIRGKMIKRIPVLDSNMGTAYGAATRLCLQQNFDIDKDDKAQSELARKFEHHVLRKLHAGTKLDD